MMDRKVSILAATAATANIGVTEEGYNAGAFVEKYQKSCIPALQLGDPWCAAFVRYRFVAAAHALVRKLPNGFPSTGYCPDWKNYAKKTGTWVPVQTAMNFPAERPRPGDLALFYFKSMKRVAHIGIVIAVHDWGVTTVEGNTGPESGDGLVERNGDGVYRKRREWMELGQFGGFMRVDI